MKFNRNHALLALIIIIFVVFCWMDTRAMDTRSAWGRVAINNEVLTDDGHIWVTDTQDFKPGERVVVKFNTQGTDMVEDDVIISMVKE